MSPRLLGWIDVADILRAFLQRKPPATPHGYGLRCASLGTSGYPCPPWAKYTCAVSGTFLLEQSTPAGLTADVHGAGHKMPTQMLALMNLLEKEGPVFSDRLLVTVPGGGRGTRHHGQAWL